MPSTGCSTIHTTEDVAVTFDENQSQINPKSSSETIRASCAFDTFDGPRLIRLLHGPAYIVSVFGRRSRWRNANADTGELWADVHPCRMKLLRTPRSEAQHFREDKPGRRSAAKLLAKA